MLTWDWVKSGDGIQGALPHGPVASKSRIPEGLEDVASNTHEIVPDQVWMTSGLVALSCPLSGMCRVGVLDPGHPPNALLHWKTYSPGDCCLCNKHVYDPLWEGLRKDRPTFLVPEDVEEDPKFPDRFVPQKHGVKLAEKCSVSFCLQCWCRWGRRMMATRKDSHCVPCVCKSQGDYSCCPCGADPRLEPCALLAYRYDQGRTEQELLAEMQDQWNRPVNKKHGRFNPIPKFSWILTTIGQEARNMADIRIDIMTCGLAYRQSPWSPSKVQEGRWDWITTGSKAAKQKALYLCTWSKMFNVHTPKGPKNMHIQLNSLSIPDPKSVTHTDMQRVAWSVSAMIEDGLISTNKSLPIMPVAKKGPQTKMIARWWKRRNAVADANSKGYNPDNSE